MQKRLSIDSHLTSVTAKWFLASAIMLLLVACGEKPAQHLDLGSWYYQKGLVDDAILEYKEAIRLLPRDPRDMSRQELRLASKAHYNLAIAYSKKNWFELATVEAKKNFDLQPTQENYRLLELIERRNSLEEFDSPASSAN